MGAFCLPHPVMVSAFKICSGLCACTDMWVRFHRRCSCLFCCPDLLLYSARSGVNRVVLSGFGVRLFCFVQA